MRESSPRGIAVVDVGFTNTKIALFSPQGELLAERKAAKPPCAGAALPAHRPRADGGAVPDRPCPNSTAILPIDAIVPCAHGAAMACLDANGDLALPVMDYTSEPPAGDRGGLQEDHARLRGGLLPACCRWPSPTDCSFTGSSACWPEDFARVSTLLPWIQYVGFRLSGAPVTEISSMACQTHLLDTRTPAAVVDGEVSSDWDRLFPRMAKAWETIGTLKPEFRGDGIPRRGPRAGRRS